MNRIRTSLVVLAAAACLAVAKVTLGPLLLVTVDEVWVPMRDGVRLCARVYRPRTAVAPLPVVLMRNPYRFTFDPAFAYIASSLAARGYVVVNQDVRGTGKSEGVFNPIFQERDDGYDTVEWAAAQPWSNGKVGIWGVSYLATAAMQAAASRPPHLVAVVATATASNYHDNWTYTNGVFNHWFAQSWVGAVLSVDALQRRWSREGRTPDQVERRLDAWRAATEGELLDRARHTPLNELGDLRETAPYYREWLAHPYYDSYWSRADLESQYSQITVPILSRGGWYDIFSDGTIENFVGLRALGGSEAARLHSRLTMSPMCHGACPGNNASIYPFGIRWAFSTEPQWWDYWLKGIDTGVIREPAVKLFVMIPPEEGRAGSGYWIGEHEYPLSGTRWTRWYLRSGGQANTRHGDGTLEPTAPSSGEPADHFVYDPYDPVPTRGGKLCCSDLVPAGVFDQSQIELRKDVLVYTSAPLAKQLVIVGPVRLTFWAASTAADTDFTAKLVDVRRDGVALNLLDSVVTARLRSGSKRQPLPIEPGSAYAYELQLGHIAVALRAGHRIRLEISSSNFPRFARNPNTGGASATDGDLRSAVQTLMHDAAHASYVELPLVMRSTLLADSHEVQ